MVKIHFCRSKGWAAAIIRVGTMSPFNHVSIEVDGLVYEALTRRGVVHRRADLFGAAWSRVETVSVAIPDADSVRLFLKNQIGKPYDWGGVFALPFRANWHNQDKWFCSELVAAALEAGGLNLGVSARRVTPRDLYLAASILASHLSFAGSRQT